MKKSALTAILVGVSSAVTTETLSALMQHASFSEPENPRKPIRYDHTNPFGQNSNINDSDIKRVNPDFAHPSRRG